MDSIQIDLLTMFHINLRSHMGLRKAVSDVSVTFLRLLSMVRHQKSKTGVSVAPEKGQVSINFF